MSLATGEDAQTAQNSFGAHRTAKGNKTWCPVEWEPESLTGHRPARASMATPGRPAVLYPKRRLRMATAVSLIIAPKCLSVRPQQDE